MPKASLCRVILRTLTQMDGEKGKLCNRGTGLPNENSADGFHRSRCREMVWIYLAVFNAAASRDFFRLTVGRGSTPDFTALSRVE